MADVQLTEGAIKEILDGQQVHAAVLQVINSKPIKTGDNVRYRLKLSDGKYFTASVMLATQLNHLMDNEITLNCIISLQRYVINHVQASRKVIIVLAADTIVSGSSIGSMIGNPVVYESDGDASANEASRPSNPARNVPAAAKPSLAPGVHPIMSLNPYQNKWTIRARVTNKSNIRTWSNSRGQGKLFSVDVIDDSGEIRATAFNEQCDKFYDMMEVGKVYMISQAQLKTANKQYNNLKNDYEMSFTPGTQVAPCDDADDLPTIQFDFVRITDIESIERESVIDVIGICKDTAEVETITQKSSGKELKKRDLQILDESNKEIRLTLWGSQAESFDGSLFPIVAVKGVKVSDFNGKSLSCLSNSTMQVNPDIKESHRLRAWFENSGRNLDSVNISGGRGGAGSNLWSSFKVMAEAVAQNLGCGDKPDYYTSKVVPTMIRKENCMYPACPADACNKKVIDMNNGIYRCEKCNKEYDTFQWRLLLNMCLTDGTGSVWATVFQDQAEAILGSSADKLAILKEQDESAYQSVFNEACFKEFVVKLRVKLEKYNDESRLRSSVVNVQPFEAKEYNKILVDEIRKMSGMA